MVESQSSIFWHYITVLRQLSGSSPSLLSSYFNVCLEFDPLSVISRPPLSFLILNYSLIGIKSACKAMLCSGVFMITLEFVSVLTHRFIIFSSAERLNLRSVSDYKYLNQSGCATIGGVDDAKNFHQLMVYFLTVCLI